MPIFVELDKLDGYQADGRAIYTGNVRATQGELQLTTDKLTAVCSRAVAPAGQTAAAQPCEEIRQLIAESNVLFVAPRLQIGGDRAEYDYPTDTITITGDPVIMRREDEAVIRGKKVVYQVAAGVASISSSGDRVQAILTPQPRDSTTPAQPAPSQPAPPPARPN